MTMAKDDKWQLYVVRGFGKDKFDPSQIEAGLALELQPQLHLAPMAQGSEVFRDLVSYIDSNPEVSFEFVDAKGEFLGDTESLSASLETIVDINSALKKPRITHAIFKAGALQTHEEKHRLMREEGYSPEAAAFLNKEYLNGLEKAKKNIQAFKEEASVSSITLLIENVYPANFDIVEGTEEKPKELQDADLRWGKTRWMPSIIQLGDIGVVHDLKHLCLGICLDIEHFEGAIEYSKLHNQTNRPTEHSWELSPLEKDLWYEYGIFIARGYPIDFDSEINRSRAIEQMPEIPIAHLGGQVNMFYYDIFQGERVPVIGSHMPITGPYEENEFIRDPSLREKMGEIRIQNLQEYLSSLHEKGTRKAVLEHHVGEYTGPKWDKYTKMSRDNVRRTLQDIGAQVT